VHGTIPASHNTTVTCSAGVTSYMIFNSFKLGKSRHSDRMGVSKEEVAGWLWWADAIDVVDPKASEGSTKGWGSVVVLTRSSGSPILASVSAARKATKAQKPTNLIPNK
jgi:hypothetical protein